MKTITDGQWRVGFLQHVVYRAITAVALALSVLGGTAKAQPAEPVKNIVLVHGAFLDGSSWAKVIPILQARGYNVTAVQNPLTSIADDVAATNRALARQTGSVMLVGHSMGGMAITEAGMDPKVVGLVYVAAYAPDAGEVMGEVAKKYPPPPALAPAAVDKQGFMTLPADVFVKRFASDVPPAEARILAATQGPINSSFLTGTVSNVAWKTKPSWYIVSKLDEALPPDEQRFFANRMKATITELNTNHVPMMSKPSEVAAAIIEAAAMVPRVVGKKP
ncbi:MAG TPA: alpha/beta hydrolase [Gemmatimonadaceae bacterium]